MLTDAFSRALGAADSIGVHALEVWAKGEQARRFYLRYGFIELADDPLHLYMPMRVLRKLGLL